MNVGRLAALAGTSAVLAAVVLPAPFAAAAGEPGDRLHVDNTVACSDTGPATAAQPLCTISAAAKIVLPGQTVVVSQTGTYQEAVLINRSGTPEKPITFTTGTTRDARTQGFGSTVTGVAADPAFTVKGASDVVIHGFAVNTGGTGPKVVVTDSARVTVDHLRMVLSTGSQPGIRVTGKGTQVTVSRNYIRGAGVASVQVDGGVYDTVVSTNHIADSGPDGILLSDSTTAQVTSNSVLGACGTGIRLTGTSSGSAIRNNVVTGGTSCTDPTLRPAIQVDPAAVPGSNLDYNLTNPATGHLPYSWNGHGYADPAGLTTATRQGTHDLLGDPRIQGADGPGQGSPAVDSGDGDPRGGLPTDYFGNAPADDPGVADTGTGSGIRDRGAFERQGVAKQLVEITGEQGPYPRPVTAQVTLTQNWPAALTYSFDFGDGSTPTVTGLPTADHTYTRAGTFRTAVTVTTPEGVGYPAVAQKPLTVTEPGAAKAAFTAKRCDEATFDCGALAYDFDTSASTTSWPFANGRLDYGDGTDTNLFGLPKSVRHTFPRPGDYTVTLTFTNRGGEKATTSQRVSVTTRPVGFDGYGAQRALDTRESGTKLAPGQKLTLNLTNSNSWPISWDATAVVLNVTAVNAEGPGFLTLGPNDRPRPDSSSLNYVPGTAVPNLVTVPIGNDFRLAVWNSYGAPVDLVIDIQGEYTPRATDLYAPLQPKRVMDSRSGIGVPAGKISSVCTAASTRPVTKLKVRGVNGVPNDATDVVLNVTVTEPDMDGNLMVNDTAAVNTSNLNFKAGQTTSNQVITRIADDGTIAFCNNAGALHIVADVFGYYGPNGQHLFVATDPTRLLDSRVSPGKLAPYSRATVRGLPAGASGAVLNVTATEPTADGFLAVYPGGTDRPDVSTVNFAAGQTVATHATVPVGGDGTISLYNHNGGTHAVVDSSGYFVHK
ncbi:PKD domain-containing protein [Kitasatospora sp. NPDC056783]|uniref:PKD domain-containing protein n=1 Tax=Kitasatospora sp. NPDC056783 TaxID=3345943 RepID=UPI0036841C2C